MAPFHRTFEYWISLRGVMLAPLCGGSKKSSSCCQTGHVFFVWKKNQRTVIAYRSVCKNISGITRLRCFTFCHLHKILPIIPNFFSRRFSVWLFKISNLCFKSARRRISSTDAFSVWIKKALWKVFVNIFCRQTLLVS